MNDPVIAGFAALVRHRKRIEWPDPDLAMLADHFDDLGDRGMASFLREDIRVVYVTQNDTAADWRARFRKPRTEGMSHYASMMQLYRMLNAKENP